VSQPASDHIDVDAGFQKVYGGGVAPIFPTTSGAPLSTLPDYVERDRTAVALNRESQVTVRTW